MDSQDQRQGGHPREGVAHHQNKAMVGCATFRGGLFYDLGTYKGAGVPTII